MQVGPEKVYCARITWSHHHWFREGYFTYLLIYLFILQEKKKELQLTFEEEERRIRMKSLGNIR